MSFESAFERDVGSGTPHQLDEVPVFFSGIRIALNVADQFAVDFGSGVETERCFDEFVLEVAVDGFRAADDLNGNVFLLVVFGKEAGVGVGVVAADDDEGGDSKSLAVFRAFIELLFQFEFGSAGTDHVESAGVAVCVHEIIGDFDIAVVDESARTAFEAIEFAAGVEALDAVIQSGDDVVSAGSLSAGEDDADVDRFHFRFGIGFFKLEHRHVAGGREESVDFLCIGERLEFFSFDAFDSRAGAESCRELGLVAESCLLQGGNGSVHKNLLRY